MMEGKKIITIMFTKEEKEERKAKPACVSRQAKLASSNGQNSRVIIDHIATDPLTSVGIRWLSLCGIQGKSIPHCGMFQRMLSYFSLLSLIEKLHFAKLNGLITFCSSKRGEMEESRLYLL